MQSFKYFQKERYLLLLNIDCSYNITNINFYVKVVTFIQISWLKCRVQKLLECPRLWTSQEFLTSSWGRDCPTAMRSSSSRRARMSHSRWLWKLFWKKVVELNFIIFQQFCRSFEDSSDFSLAGEGSIEHSKKEQKIIVYSRQSKHYLEYLILTLWCNFQSDVPQNKLRHSQTRLFFLQIYNLERRLTQEMKKEKLWF